MKTSIKFVAMIAAIGAFAFTSCKKEDIAPNPGTASNASTMKVRMTDAPADFASLDVQIIRVEAHLQDSGWITLNDQSQMISVLDLNNGIYSSLTADVPVSAGLYSEVRITFGNENTLAFNAGANTSGLNLNADGSLSLAYTGPQQVVIPIDQQVDAGAHVTVSLDFNAAQSIIQTLNDYVLQPAISEVDAAEGAISGQVQGGADAAVMISNGLFQASTYANASGQFMANGIPDGSYLLTILPTPAEVAAGLPQQFVLQNVTVVSGQVTSMGVINLQ